jgi:hypothetical protein
MRRFIREHTSESTYAAINTAVVNASAQLCFKDGFFDVDTEHVMLTGFYQVELFYENLEGLFNWRLDDYLLPDDGFLLLRDHGISLSFSFLTVRRPLCTPPAPWSRNGQAGRDAQLDQHD